MEIKSISKIMRNKLSTIIAALFVACALPSFGGAQLQNQLSGGTNNCTTGNTNTYAISEDVTGTYTNGIAQGGYVGPLKHIQCDVAKDMPLQLDFLAINTGTGASTNTFRIAGSEDLQHWTNNYAVSTVIVPAASTNWVTVLIQSTNTPTGVALRSVEMPTQSGTTTTITNLAFRGRDKK